MDNSKAIGTTFTDKPVTAFGGLALFVAFAERSALAAKLAEVLPFLLTSPNATPPHHIVLASLAGVLAGARRFAHGLAPQWQHGLSLRGDLEGRRAAADAPAVPRDALAGHVPRVPPTPTPDLRQLQCSSGDGG